MGQISDRESSSPVPAVTIDQQQSDGTWKTIGETDGNGKWWIMKDQLRTGGRIRLSKPGYYSRTMRESEFLQENSLLMVPGGDSDMDDTPGNMWHGGHESLGGRSG